MSKSFEFAFLVSNCFWIISRSPIRTILSDVSSSLQALIAPATVASGAKSPPITSSPILI